MEAASCSIIYSFQLSCTKTYPFYRSLGNEVSPNTVKKLCTSLSPPAFLRKAKIPRKCLRFQEFSAFSSPPSRDNVNPSEELGVILEVDGVMIDAYRWGNRQAFNVAFQKLGLDCASWPEPVYSDLLRKGAGDEERMLILFFNRIGWPTSLPTSEKGNFLKSVLREKQKAMDEILMSKSLPLRSGIEEFIDTACKEGVPVAVVTAYYKSGDKVGRSIVEKLGQERVSNVKVIGNEEVEQSMYAQLVLGKGVSSSLEDQLATQARNAASAEKQRVAEEVASMLKLSVDINSSSSESMQKIATALRAAAEYIGLPVSNCVLVAGSQPGAAAAEMIGMPCVVLRSSSTARGEFPSAKAVIDGFGGADLTISKLKLKLKS